MATKKPKGLGRGLEALLGPTAHNSNPLDLNDARANDLHTPSSLALELVQAGAYQPRTRMDEGALYELAESIKAQGIMQPILVRPLAAIAESGATHEIIAGERRFRAAKLAGLDRIPVLVRDVPDESAAAMALIENIQREDLNPLEEAQGLQRLVKEFGLSHEQAALAVGRSRSAASNLLRLLQLTPAVQTMLMAGDLDMGHARALLGLASAAQVSTAHQIAAKKLSVREAEALVKRVAAEASAVHPASTAKASEAARPRDLQRAEEALADALGARVEVRFKNAQKALKPGAQGSLASAGELVMGFGSLDALNGLLERLQTALEGKP